MSSSFWSRLPTLQNMLATLVRGLAVVQRGRTAAADNIRQIVPGIRDGFAAYCGLLVLLGMITAGFVLLPLGLLLLILGLLHDSADRNLVGGVALSLVALFYLVGPVLFIQVASRLAFGRLQRRANHLADRVEGKR